MKAQEPDRSTGSQEATHLCKDDFIAHKALAILATRCIVVEPDTVDVPLLFVPAVLALHIFMHLPVPLPLHAGGRKPQVLVRHTSALLLQIHRTQDTGCFSGPGVVSAVVGSQQHRWLQRCLQQLPTPEVLAAQQHDPLLAGVCFSA